MKVAGIGWNEIMVIVMAVGSTEAAQANPVGGRGKVQCSAVQCSAVQVPATAGGRAGSTSSTACRVESCPPTLSNLALPIGLLFVACNARSYSQIVGLMANKVLLDGGTNVR